MLEQTDRMPDLQSDFTNSQYKMVYRKSKALTGGLRPDQISPQKLRELLEEMERLGPQGRWQLERRRHGRHGGARGRPERSGPGGDAEGARQDARDGRGAALRQGPARRARVRARRARQGPRTRRRHGSGGPGFRRRRGAHAGQGPEREPEGRGHPAAARQPVRRGRRGRSRVRAARTATTPT